MGDSPQPTAKTSIGSIFELSHLPAKVEHDVLRHVLGIHILQTPLATPAINNDAVAIDELGPGGLIVRAVAQPAQQRRRSAIVARGLGHGEIVLSAIADFKC